MSNANALSLYEPLGVEAAKQKSFLTMAFGAPNNYTSPGMRQAHARLVKKYGLNDSHSDTVMELRSTALQELNVPGELIAKTAAIAESALNDVPGR